MNYDEHLREHRRLTMLRILSEAPQYSGNESILHAALDSFGVGVSRDQVRTDLTWLSEQGLVDIEDLSGLAVATLLERGHDVANGRAKVPGIARPSPRR